MTWEARMAERAKARQPRAALADQIAHERGDVTRGEHIWREVSRGSNWRDSVCRYCGKETHAVFAVAYEGDGSVTEE